MLTFVVAELDLKISGLGRDKPLAWRMDAAKGVVVGLRPALQEEANRPCDQAWAF